MTELDMVYQQIVDHPSNAWAKEKGYLPVYSVNSNAQIVIVGQAPGRYAQQTMTPWNDASGVRLRRWLGVSDEVFYDAQKIALVPMDFYYPGKGVHGDIPPRKSFASFWHPQLFQHMPNICMIILVGAYAQAYYLGDSCKATVTETVAHYAHYMPRYFPLVHPSPRNFRWLSRNPWFEQQVIPELQQEVATILSNQSDF